MNNTNLIGRLTDDPQTRYTASGSPVANFSIAVDDGYGEKKHTSFFSCSAFGKTAENIQKFFHKGKKIALSGKMKQERWQDQNGANKSKIIVIVNGFDFLEPKNGGKQNYPQQNYNQNYPQQNYNQNYNGQINDPWEAK